LGEVAVIDPSHTILKVQKGFFLIGNALLKPARCPKQGAPALQQLIKALERFPASPAGSLLKRD